MEYRLKPILEVFMLLLYFSNASIITSPTQSVNSNYIVINSGIRDLLNVSCGEAGFVRLEKILVRSYF